LAAAYRAIRMGWDRRDKRFYVFLSMMFLKDGAQA
jgi:hypothetical protein